MKGKLLFFVLGLIVGAVLLVVLKPVLLPRMPEFLRGKAKATQGRVVAKRLQGDRLLLTVDASEGAVLATFTQKVPEIDLLVDDGDLVTLDLPAYEPFADNPTIRAVRKKQLGERDETRTPAGPPMATDGAPVPSQSEGGMAGEAQQGAPSGAAEEGAQQEGAQPPPS